MDIDINIALFFKNNFTSVSYITIKIIQIDVQFHRALIGIILLLYKKLKSKYF
jgi:hypothetical protein